MGEDTLTGTSLFQQNGVKENMVNSAKVAPLPSYLAYDAFTNDVPAHIIWEIIQMTDQEDMEEVFEYTKNFLMASHVNHNVTNNKNLQVDSQFFMEHQSMEAKQWGQLRRNFCIPLTHITLIKSKRPFNCRHDLSHNKNYRAAKYKRYQWHTTCTNTSTSNRCSRRKLQKIQDE